MQSGSIYYIILWECTTVLHLLPATASCTNLVQKNQISWAKPAHYDFFIIIFTVWSHILSTPHVIWATSQKCIIRFEASRCGFPRTGSGGPGANQHENMSCFSSGLALISAGWKLCTTKHEPQNKNLKTYHPPKHVKFQQVVWRMFQCPGSPSPLNISHQNM